MLPILYRHPTPVPPASYYREPRPNVAPGRGQADVDSDTEALIQDALVRLIEGRTSVVVAHRLSTIRHADRILVFHHGELREQGGHEELLARGGIYARLYRLQFGTGDVDHGAA